MKSSTASDRLCAYLFVVYGLLSILIVVWKLPPFMGPDELNHIKRANLLTHGSLIGTRVEQGSGVLAGGVCEVNLDKVEAIFHPIEFHPEVKVNSANYSRADSVLWGARSEWQRFENTAPYPPFFYLPQTLAIGFGKLFGQPILRTIGMARIANALCCLLVGFVALLMAGRARFFLFTVLLLPMSTMLYSTVTQDGLLIATSALACALMARSLSEGQPMTKAQTWVAASCLTLVGLSKPPYLLLILLLLLINTERRQWRFTAVGIAVGLCVIWHLAVAFFVQAPIVQPDRITDPSGQIRFLLRNPSDVFAIAANTLHHSGPEYAAQLVGVLGWLDTLLPKSYYGLAFLILGIAAVLTWSAKPKGGTGRSMGALAVLTLTMTAVFAAIYVSFTPVGLQHIDGVQGRYFLPVLIMLPMVLAGEERKPAAWPRRIAISAVLVFPILSLWAVEHALTNRYWG